MSDSTPSSRKLTTEKFINGSISSHGHKYDYSNSICTGSDDKVEIICSSHGSFFQRARNHMSGLGCSFCSRGYKDPTKPMGIEEFIRRSKAFHGDKYDYSKSIYTKARNKIEILCKRHGYFHQIASEHMCGKGCNLCGNEVISKKQIGSKADFVRKSKERHGDRYYYSLVNYVKSNVKVDIICREHGIFSQTPASHISGNGCMDCSHLDRYGYKRSKYILQCNKRNKGLSNLYVVIVTGNSEVFYKVGITSRTTKSRFRQASKEYNFSEILLVSGTASFIWDLEKRVHRMLNSKKYTPKIHFDGYTECFESIGSDVLLMLKKFNNTNQMQLIA